MKYTITLPLTLLLSLNSFATDNNGNATVLPTPKLVQELHKQGKRIVHKPASLEKLKQDKENKK